MRAAATALCMLLAGQAAAQSFVSMGRLFTTPSERAQLDAQRGQSPPSAAAAPGAMPQVAGTTPAVPMGAAATAAVDAAPPCPAGAPGCAAAAQQEALVQPDPGLRLDGIVRRSNGRTMVIVNGEVQPAPEGGVTRGTVTLQADGRSVVLKPGQRYDPATGVTHEAAR